MCNFRAYSGLPPQLFPGHPDRVSSSWSCPSPSSSGSSCHDDGAHRFSAKERVGFGRRCPVTVWDDIGVDFLGGGGRGGRGRMR